VAAGVLRLGEAARLVRRRGALMQQAVPAGQGAMLAVVGRALDIGELRAQLEGLQVDAANHNSSSQIVVSGSASDMDEAKARLGGKGRRLIALNVSAPFHSRLMREVEAAFAEELAGAAIEAGEAPHVASNYTGGFHSADAAAVRDALVRQISGTVRWVDNMRAIAERASRIVEIGPGKPLSGFFKDVGSTVQAIEAAREFGFEVAGVMCLVEREEAKGRPSVEKAASPAPFVSIFSASDVRKEHVLQNDDTQPGIFAVSAACEVCGRPAVTNNPRNRCDAHRT